MILFADKTALAQCLLYFKDSSIITPKSLSQELFVTTTPQIE